MPFLSEGDVARAVCTTRAADFPPRALVWALQTLSSVCTAEYDQLAGPGRRPARPEEEEAGVELRRLQVRATAHTHTTQVPEAHLLSQCQSLFVLG